MVGIPSFEITETPLDESSSEEIIVETRVDPSSPIERNSVAELSTILEVPPSEIEAARSERDFSAEGLAKQYPDMESYLNTLYEAGIPIEQAGTMTKEYIARKEIAIAPREFILNSILLVDDDTINKETLQVFTNYEILQKRFAEKLEANDPSTFKWITAGFGELGRDFTTNVIKNLFRGDQARSEEYVQTLSMNSEEFDTYWDEEFESIEARGLFNIREYESIKDAIEIVDNFGVDENAGFNQLIAILDIATLGVTKTAGRLLSSGSKAAGSKVLNNVPSRETIKRLMAARSPSEAITATKGAEAGGKATVLQLNNGSASTQVAGKAGPSTLDPTPNVNVPHSATVIEGTKTSMMFNRMSELMDGIITGKTFSMEDLGKATEEVAARLKVASTNAFVKLSRTRTEGNDQYIYTAIMGKNKDGAAFPTKAAAMKAVKDDPRYVPIRRNSDELEADFGVNESKRGWYLRYEERIDTSKLGDEIESVTVEEGFIKRASARILSAGQTALGPRLGFMLNAAESMVSKIGKEADVILKDLTALSKEELEAVNKVMKSYRDGPSGDVELDLASTRAVPSDGEFAAAFKLINNRIPSEKEMKAYRTLVDFNNSSWNIKATAILKTVVARKGWNVTLSNDFSAIGVVHETVKDTDIIFSTLQGRVKGSNVGDRIVYRLDTPFMDVDGKHYMFVTDVKKANIPQKSDVLGYNFGGSRNNETLNFFIGTVTKVTPEGGSEMVTGFRTLVGSFSARDAKKAVTELNNIQASLAPIFKSLSIKSIKELNLSGANLIRVNKVIAANNSWNPNITTFADLKAASVARKETFTSKFDLKRRDEQVDAEIVDGQGMNIGEYQSMKVARKRGDAPLTEYGGAEVVNQDPVKNIIEQFQSSAYGFAHYKATQAGINGWVSKAKRLKNVRFDGAEPSNPEDYIRLAKVQAKNTGSKSVEADMIDQQSVLKRRLNIHEAADKEHTYYSMAAQYIFDEGVFKLGKGLKTKPEDWIGGAAGRARGFVFHLKMGLANPDQFVLNASHVAQIIAISPLAGAKASVAVPVIYQLMRKTEKAMLADIDSMYKKGFSGMSKQELLDTVRYMRESGRDVVGSSVLERSGAAFGNNQTLVAEALELGLTPFKMGELYGRIAAAGAAIIEYGAKGNKGGVFTEKGLQFVANREQVMSFRMTSGQKGAYQEGAILGLATQWQSYTLRFADNVLIGRDLTGAERARMVGFNTILFGTRGMGFPAKWTAGAAALGIDPQDENSTNSLNIVKFGLFDYLLNLPTSGADVSLGSRISPLGGLVQQYQELFAEDPFLIAATGPSGQIGYDAYKAIKSMITVLTGGHRHIFEEELALLLRNVKSVDMYQKIKDLIETGEYRSKRGSLAGTFDESERTYGLAASIIGGATPMRVLNHYDAKDISYKEDAKYKDARKNIDRWSDEAYNLIATGEPAKMRAGNALFEDVMDLISDGGFSVENQTKLYRSVVRMETVVDLMKRATGQSTGSQLTAKAASGE